jgi:hypothetical protein
MPGRATPAITPVPRTLFAIGVAILVAVLGMPSGAHAVLDSFDHACLVIGAFAIAGALASLAILGLGRPAPFGRPSRASVAAAARGRT